MRGECRKGVASPYGGYVRKVVPFTSDGYLIYLGRVLPLPMVDKLGRVFRLGMTGECRKGVASHDGG